MSKSIRSYPEEERRMVVKRRLESNTGGIGYWAARDAEYRITVEEAKKRIAKANKLNKK